MVYFNVNYTPKIQKIIYKLNNLYCVNNVTCDVRLSFDDWMRDGIILPLVRSIMQAKYLNESTVVRRI